MQIAKKSIDIKYIKKLPKYKKSTKLLFCFINIYVKLTQVYSNIIILVF